MNESTSHDSEWEWGWKTPLLLFLGEVPAPVKNLLRFPLEALDLKHAAIRLDQSLTKLKTSRIGIRFERIQEALMSAHPDTESLRSSIQIPGITEIDLLQKLKSLPDTSIHWEIAVKFYLAVDVKGSSNPDRWIGPSQQDALGIKMRVIQNRQLTVLKDPGIRASLGIPETEKIIALPKVHGVLFVPWTSGTSLIAFTQDLDCPAGIGPQSQRGFWIRESDAHSFLISIREEFGTKVRIFILADRKEWIRDHTREEWITTAGGIPAVTAAETSLKHYFNIRAKTQRPSDAPVGEPFQGLIVVNDGSRLCEFRFFCVPDAWQDSAEGALETLRSQSRMRE